MCSSIVQFFGFFQEAFTKSASQQNLLPVDEEDSACDKVVDMKRRRRLIFILLIAAITTVLLVLAATIPFLLGESSLTLIYFSFSLVT